MNSLVNFVLDRGGEDFNLLYPSHLLNGEYATCNTSIITYGPGLLINTRLVNYGKLFQNEDYKYVGGDRNQTYLYTENGFETRNVQFFYTKENGISSIKEIGEVEFPVGSVPALYRGMEDCKMVRWGNKIYAYGTRWDKIENMGCMCIYELDNELKPKNEIVIRNPNNNLCEKNWGAIEGQPFKFVYLVNPTQVIEVDKNGECHLIDNHPEIKRINEEAGAIIKGSTCVVRYSENEYVSLVHTTKYKQKDNFNPCEYRTAFVFYDNNFNITRMSDWFVFKSLMCEFSCGLAVNGEDVYISYSQLDSTVNLLATTKSVIEEFVNHHIDDNNVYDFNYFYDLAFEYENSNHWLTANVLYNYCAYLCSADKSIKPEVKLECIIRSFAKIMFNEKSEWDDNMFAEMIKCVDKQIEEYPNECEFYYIKAYMYKKMNRIEEYRNALNQAYERKYRIHNYFFKYINPNYL